MWDDQHFDDSHPTNVPYEVFRERLVLRQIQFVDVSSEDLREHPIPLPCNIPQQMLLQGLALSGNEPARIIIISDELVHIFKADNGAWQGTMALVSQHTVESVLNGSVFVGKDN